MGSNVILNPVNIPKEVPVSKKEDTDSTYYRQGEAPVSVKLTSESIY